MGEEHTGLQPSYATVLKGNVPGNSPNTTEKCYSGKDWPKELRKASKMGPFW